MSRSAVRALRPALVCVGVLGLTWAAVRYARHVPEVIPAYAPLTLFSAHRATSDVQKMSQYSHATGSPGSAMILGYLMDQLRDLGLQPSVHTATAVGTRYPVVGRVSNVVARLRGARSNGKAVLLMAHYDAVPASPGAGDDGSGVATILETLRVLRAGPPLANDVIALFTDGEEAGLLGAAAFVREHPWSRDVAVVLNFEARGTEGPSLMFETGPGNLDVVRALRGARGVRARATSLSTTVYRRLPNDTDLSELAALGVPAMNFAFIGGVNRYHTAEDDIAHLDARSVQHHGDQALALTRAFANGPLPRPRTGDAVFFDVPVLGLVVYPESWAPAFSLLGVVLTVLVAIRGSRNANGGGAGSRPSVAIGAGAIATLVVAVVCAVMGGVIGFGLQRLHAGLRTGSPDSSGVYASAIALAAVAATAGAMDLLSRTRLKPERGIGVGVLVAWTLIAVCLSFLAPGASFVFVWPAITVAAAWLPGPGPGRTIATWLAIAVTIFLVVPIAYLMACVALGTNQVGGAVLGMFASLVSALILSQISMDAAEARWAALGAAVAAVALLLIGGLTVRTDAAHPAGVSLVYAADADSAGAWLTGYGSSASANARLRRFLRDMEPQVSAPGTAPAWLSRTFASTGIVPVPRIDLARSEATVLRDSTVGNERRLAIRFRPAPGTYSVAMATESGSVVRAAVDGHIVRTDRYRSPQQRWNLSYVAPPDSGFLLELLIPAATPTTLTFSTRGYGVPPIRLPPRPEGVVQVQGGNMTWMYYRLTL